MITRLMDKKTEKKTGVDERIRAFTVNAKTAELGEERYRRTPNLSQPRAHSRVFIDRPSP